MKIIWFDAALLDFVCSKVLKDLFAYNFLTYKISTTDDAVFLTIHLLEVMTSKMIMALE